MNVFRELPELLFTALQSLLGLLARSDIPKEPNASQMSAAGAPETGGVAFEYAAVFQFSFGMVVYLRMGVKFLDPPQESLGIFHPLEARGQDRLVATSGIGQI